MSIQARPWLDRVEPYRPGRHAASVLGSLASNESALGASPRVAEAVARAVADVARYPSPLADSLRGEIAAEHDVDPDQVLVGNGSDELIYLLAMAYLASGGHVVCADPAYRIDEISAHVVDARVTKVPLRDWEHDLETMASVPADIAYVVNPHNPTGTTRSRGDIERFVADADAELVVIDEAYVDFADEPDRLTAMSLAREGRAAVLRTFSKVHGLAGVRIGYLVAEREIIATLRKIRAPFSVGSLAQAAALAAVRDPGHRDGVRSHALRVRKDLVRVLEAAGHEVVPSAANFVLVVTPNEEEFVSTLAAGGVSVRPGSALGLPGTTRISVPTDEGLDLLARVLPPRTTSPVSPRTNL